MLEDGEGVVTMETKEKMGDEIGKRNFPWTLCRRPRIYWGWIVAVSSSIVFVVIYGFLYSFGIIMVDLMNEFDSSATKTGYIGTMAYGLSSLSCLIAAPMTVRFGHRLASMFGMILCVISCIVTSFAPDLSLMFFSHGFLYGFGASLLLCGGINVTMSYFPGKNNSLATAVSSAGANLGVLIMNPIVNSLSARYGWRNMFRIISAVLAVVGVPAILTFAPASLGLSTAEEVDAETSEEKSSVLKKNSEAFVEDKASKNVSEHSFEITHRNGFDETTPVWILAGRRGNVEDKSTVLTSDSKYIREYNANMKGCNLKDGIGAEEQSSLLVTNGTVNGIIGYHNNGDASLVIGSNNNRSQESHKVPHLNGVSSLGLDSSLDSGTDENESRPADTAKPSTSSDVYEAQRNTYWRRLSRLLRMPDVWFLEVGLLIASIGLSFLMFSTANVIVTAGFSKNTASMVMAVMGLSEFFGKIIIGFVSDRLPIPKIFIIMAANCVGALLILIMSFVATKPYLFTQATVQGLFVLAALDSLPHSVGNQLYSSEFCVQIWAANMVFMGIGGIFGAMLGESVDKTGSYSAAFYATIAIFIVSTIFLALTVAHQRVFARERFFVFTNVGKRYAKMQRNGENMKEGKVEHCKKLLHSSPGIIVTDCVSSV